MGKVILIVEVIFVVQIVILTTRIINRVYQDKCVRMANVYVQRQMEKSVIIIISVSIRKLVKIVQYVHVIQMMRVLMEFASLTEM